MRTPPLALALALALAACAHEPQPEVAVVLSGAMEAPPVQTTATGEAVIVVDDDGTVSGVVLAPNIPGATVAIEDDAADAATPVVVMLVPAGEGRWQVPAGTRLTAAQMAHYKGGKLAANVRSRAHPKGEVRAHLRGNTRSKMGASGYR
jgi:hypothetical protein